MGHAVASLVLGTNGSDGYLPWKEFGTARRVRLAPCRCCRHSCLASDLIHVICITIVLAVFGPWSSGHGGGEGDPSAMVDFAEKAVS